MSAPSGRAPLDVAVGIVVVSHSRALADAAAALAAEMLYGRPARIAVAAGLDDARFGTDAVRIAAAIEQVDSQAGVVVLMDLGSAVLSAELALELLPDAEVRERVLLCPAALVEGLVVATVAAAGGASREEVAAEASNALLGKSTHLGLAAGPARPVQAEHRVVARFTVANPHGLHARPAARLVGELRRLDAAVTLRNLTTGAAPAPADSLSRVATIGAMLGHEVEVAAAGPQAQAAVDHVLALASRRFDEPDQPDHQDHPDQRDAPRPAEARSRSHRPVPGAARALAAAPGVGAGPAVRLRVPTAVADKPATGPPSAEWGRLNSALADARRDLERLRAAVAGTAGQESASVFDAHLLLLEDASLLAEAQSGTEAGLSAAAAWRAAASAAALQWAALPDPYLASRAADLRDLAERVLRALEGVPAEQSGRPAGAGVLVADDLSPTEAATLDPARIRGVVLAGGSPTSHACILLRSLGIPAIAAAGAAVLALAEGTFLLVDGSAGRLVVDPLPDVVAEHARRTTQLSEQRLRDGAAATRPARTRDGVTVAVAANVASVSDARAAAAGGADGAGLVRTEFLFAGRDNPPPADEQEHIYREITHALGARLTTVRTLDVGGDKPLRYVRQPAEANPYLGQRGLRASLAHRDLLADQLGAICQVARSTPLRVMLPMVTTVEEVLEARAVLKHAAGAAGVPPSLQVGIMVEVPAAALRIEAFLPHVDFLSIGTNDLAQYALAAERGNSTVAHLADPLDPAVLTLVSGVVRRAAGRGAVSVCGEVASDEAAVPVLVGLGVRELSVAVTSVAAVKAAVRLLDSQECARLAERCLSAGSAAEVRRLIAAAQRPP